MDALASPTDAASFRPELAAACVRALERIAAAGTWWSGEERTAIALETRAAWDCGLCARRRDSVSPETSGEHDRGSRPGVLPEPAVEAVHRITTDPGRLHEGWLRRIVADGLSVERYVELLGVLTQILSVDEQDRVLDFPRRPLLDPIAGAPSGRRPAGAKPGPGWVPTVAPSDLDAEDHDLYGGASRAGNVIRALSLVPAEVRALGELGAEQYVPAVSFFDLGFRRALDRPQIEWVAARVSALNECFY